VLTSSIWIVRSESSRAGVRLAGPELKRKVTSELPSEPTVPGALQVPPDGRPILLGPDAPVTGGYPVIAVVHSQDLSAAAQLRPGDPVRFSVR
jgi:allophanate hydrolase subunit 2